MPVNRNNISRKFQSEVYKRFTRRNDTDRTSSNNRVRFTGRSDIPRPTETSSPIKYGPNRPKPNVNRRKDQEPEPNRPRRRRRHRNDFPRSRKPQPNRPDNNKPNHPHHKPVENNKPQPHQRTHPNKTPNPLPPRTTPRPIPTNTGPLPPKTSRYDVSDIPRRSSYPVKYGPNRPKPTDPTPPQTYPVGSKYGPNRPMPNIERKVDGSTRTSRYDFTRKDVNATPKNFDNETLLRKLNRRRNGS